MSTNKSILQAIAERDRILKYEKAQLLHTVGEAFYNKPRQPEDAAEFIADFLSHPAIINQEPTLESWKKNK